ncbi:amino acid/polyamine transporter I [Scheffersomyces amazonensis]|uniref:amino acid/polyamine transporter I n=1 Tax=Scheffersomyces amazonensis TaxID=1078765 RepID=UPI00315DBFA9
MEDTKLENQISVTVVSSFSKDGMGFNQQLEKRFGLWNTVALQYSLICSGLAIGTFLSTVIGVGGAPFLIYGFIFAVTLGLIICYSLAELASAFPHSGAQEHWSYCIAPHRFKKVLGFSSGILSCAGWIFSCFSSSYVCSMFIISLVEIYHPDFVSQNWHYYVVFTGITLLAYVLNVFLINLLPILTNVLAFIINIGTLFIVITLLVRAHPKQTVNFVFKEITNDSGWSSNGVVFFISLLPSIVSVCLFDGAVHMTDEISNPKRNIPLVMVIANTLSAVVAFICAIIYMFCVVNVENLNNPVGGEPIIQLMYDAFESKALTTIGVLFLILSFVGSTMLYYTTTSRLFWAFAKNNGLPFGTYLGSVHNTLKSPVYSITLVVTICLILGTIMFGSSTALNALLGSAMVCINMSYIFPIICLLIRSKFALSPQKRFAFFNEDEIQPVLNPSKGVPYFTLGRFGMPLNVIAVLWVCLLMVWTTFPVYYPVTPDTMNYASAVLGVTCVIGIILGFTCLKNYSHIVNSSHAYD